ncbi:MAG TPA: DNA alkylation repair protein [Gemmatimonadales bacterium]|nr:DNA alkylation repair protein [Gemmatimonadales bacterium]
MDEHSISTLVANIRDQVSACPEPTVRGLRGVRREISRRLRDLDPVLVLRTSEHLVDRRAVPRWLAYELLNQHRMAMSLLTRADVERLGDGMATWGDCDSFACYVAGPAWREGRVMTEDILDWAGSSDRWWRSAALVSTVALNNTARGGKGDAERTLVVCDRLTADRDDMVVKGMSWALRELAGKEPARVKQYLSENGGLGARVVREVRSKLETGLKNPRARRSRSGA